MQSTSSPSSNGTTNGVQLQPLKDSGLIGKAEKIPTSTPTALVSVSPVVLSTPKRAVDLQIKVSAPLTGHNLPIILHSHGHGPSNYIPSLNGYGPLVNFWAAHGFVVIQPTHLSAKSLALSSETPGAPFFWKSRVEDMSTIIDQLDQIEAAVPTIQGRLDRSRIAVTGHSMGAHTASILLGARLTDPENNDVVVNMIEPRIKAGVLLACIGNGGDNLNEWARTMLPFCINHSYAEMSTPNLVVMGDNDIPTHLSRNRGADWYTDAYHFSSGANGLLTVYGGGHGLGGISGYDAKETGDDESPERVAVVQRLTWAYLRSALYPDDPAWSVVSAALNGFDGLGKVERK